MDNKEKELLDKVKAEASAAVREVVDNSIESNASIKELKDLSTSLKEAKTIEDVKAIKTEIEKIGLDFKALKEEGKKNERPTSFAQNLMNAYKAMALAGDLTKIKGGELRSRNMTVKAAATMTTTNITPTQAGAVPFLLAVPEFGLTRQQRRMPFLMDIVSVSTINGNTAQWAESQNSDPGAAGNVAEGTSKPLSDFDVVEQKCPVEKIAHHIKVSKEMLDDVPFIQAEINNELLELLQLRADQQILLGTGTSPQLKGIDTFAQAFAAGGFAASINNANIFDVLRVAIENVEKNNFMPTHILMHPSDVAGMDLVKGSDDHYVLPPFITAGGNTIKGLPVVSNTGVAADSFYVGDFTKSNVRVRESASLFVGLENDDFTKNLVTILAELRLVHYIKQNHVNAFVKGTFTAAKAALETP